MRNSEIRIEPLTGNIGAEIHGIDLRKELPDSEFSGRLTGQLSATPGANGLALAGTYQATDFALDTGGALGVGPLAAEGTLAGDASVDASEVSLSWNNSIRGLGDTERIVQMASSLVRAGTLESTGVNSPR